MGSLHRVWYGTVLVAVMMSATALRAATVRVSFEGQVEERNAANQVTGTVDLSGVASYETDELTFVADSSGGAWFAANGIELNVNANGTTFSKFSTAVRKIDVSPINGIIRVNMTDLDGFTFVLVANAPADEITPFLSTPPTAAFWQSFSPVRTAIGARGSYSWNGFVSVLQEEPEPECEAPTVSLEATLQQLPPTYFGLVPVTFYGTISGECGA
ncbi:MAG: hypothetical protein O3A46_17085 [Candidatus Poribacteria bacterium]|nr:hypothetical protein [Candidatus Poribacteria bacterium]